MHGNRQLDVLFAATYSGCVVIERQSTQRRIVIEISAVTLLVRIMKELGDNGTVFVGHVDARVWNAVKKRVVPAHLVIEGAVASNDGRFPTGAGTISEPGL